MHACMYAEKVMLHIHWQLCLHIAVSFRGEFVFIELPRTTRRIQIQVETEPDVDNETRSKYSGTHGVPKENIVGQDPAPYDHRE